MAYAVNMKESYESIKILLKETDHSKYAWSICGNLKMLSQLLGLSAGLHKAYVLFVSLG